MKRFFFGAFGLLALASCSNDELTSVNRDGDEIAFSVVTNSATRAADVYCNNHKPSGFEVWATFNGQTYINGDNVQNQDGKWVNTSGTRYWPDDEVSFFAHVNAGDAFNWNEGQPKIENFTVRADVATQQDLLYAVKKTSKGTDGKAELNFRHALSQIVFQAKNTNPNLYVEISGVSVCKVNNQGTFTYPTSDTDNNIEDHTGTANTTIDYENGSWGTWNNTSGAENYSVAFNTVQLTGSKNATAVSLTSENETDKEFNSNAMLLLPQTSTAWSVDENATAGKPADQEGTYFLVKCQIYNVANQEVGKQDDDYCLWGENSAADVAIPVALNWEQGKKYIYTFVFGDGNGGYDPDPDDPEDPDKPTPVLVPITFEVTVDDFVPVPEREVEMDEPNA